jgi:CRP/FNR family cyclic AMP-dependent transcriptional regulator
MSTYAYRLLKNLCFSERRIRDVLPRLSIRSFEAGDVIWSKGLPVQSWYCVMSGYVAASVPLENGAQLPIHVFGQHSWFGEQSLLSEQPAYMAYSCLTPVEVIGMDKAQLAAAFDDEPEFVRFLVSLVTRRVHQHSEMLMLMRLGSSPLRAVMGLAQLAEAASSAKKVRSDAHLAHVEVPISQDLVAALCGISRTLFSEFLQHLSRAGWVRLRYGAMDLISPETWSAFAQHQRERKHVDKRPSIQDLLLKLQEASDQVAAARALQQSPAWMV